MTAQQREAQDEFSNALSRLLTVGPHRAVQSVAVRRPGGKHATCLIFAESEEDCADVVREILHGVPLTKES